LNSLQEVGHREEVYVTDCGLTPEQRGVIDRHVHLLEAPPGLPPELLKMFGPRCVDPETAVVLDADLIFRRPIHDLLTGQPVMFVDAQSNRRHPDWVLLGYPQVYIHPYFNSGTLILTTDLIPQVQEAIDRMRRLVERIPGLHETGRDPFHWADQDAINALFGSIDPSTYVVNSEVAYWPFQIRVQAARIWHHILPKPWLVPRPQTVFSREMIRLLADGPISVPTAMIPLRFRHGRRADVARVWVAARYHVS
jgi:hypothetical protein